MKKIIHAAIISHSVLILIIFLITVIAVKQSGAAEKNRFPEIIKLPAPVVDGSVSIEKTLHLRRSARNFSNTPLTLSEISQLLWAAQGITDRRGFRTAPSAGALYPLEVYIAAAGVSSIPQGIYKYSPSGHELITIAEGDKRNLICKAALGQESIKKASTVFVFSAVFERTTRKYNERGIQYVFMEVGHAAQNLCLQAVSIGIGAVVIGAFHDNEIKQIMGFQENEDPLYIVAVGRLPEK